MDNNADKWTPPKKEEKEEKKYEGKGTRKRLDTAAEKHFFRSKYST